MAETEKRLVNIEAELDEQQLSKVRFGRSRFLRLLGGTMFGLTAGLVLADREKEAYAAARRDPCGEPKCNGTDPSGVELGGNCNGAKCTNCGFNGSTCPEGNGHCWHERGWKCCDWFAPNNGEACHCAKRL